MLIKKTSFTSSKAFETFFVDIFISTSFYLYLYSLESQIIGGGAILPSQQCNAGPARVLYGQLCGPCEGSPYRNSIDLAAGPAVAPHGFNRTGFVAA